MCIGVPVRETAPVVDEWISNAAAGGSSEELDGEGEWTAAASPAFTTGAPQHSLLLLAWPVRNVHACRNVQFVSRCACV